MTCVYGRHHLRLTYKLYSDIYRTRLNNYTVYLSLETAVHVSGGISTHHQERIQLYLQHLVLKPLLQPVAIMEEMELQL